MREGVIAHANQIARQECVGRVLGLLEDEGGVVTRQHVLQHGAVVEPRGREVGGVGEVHVVVCGQQRGEVEDGLGGHGEEAELRLTGAHGAGWR